MFSYLGEFCYDYDQAIAHLMNICVESVLSISKI